ncbi:MAG: hypothetical protein Q9M29_05515, partial [Mariprofundaceae bacterium]|nr:hypothetical protein [Mariprofundaceae bacterium]
SHMFLNQDTGTRMLLTNRHEQSSIRAMQIACPHCQAVYQVKAEGIHAIFICHRCGTEFGYGNEPESTDETSGRTPEEQLPLFSQPAASPPAEASTPESHAMQKSERSATVAGDSEDIVAAADEASSADTTPRDETAAELLPPPERAVARIWPWLTAMLIIIGGTGFWLKHEVWLDNTWFRSLLINMHLPVTVRNKDWHIIPDSVHAQWIKRSDGSQALLIEGRIENLLYSEIPLPEIEIRFYSALDPEKPMATRRLVITQPPTIEAIRQAPFHAPPADKVPVAARGERGFVLLLDSLPENTGDFTLTAIAGKKP